MISNLFRGASYCKLDIFLSQCCNSDSHSLPKRCALRNKNTAKSNWSLLSCSQIIDIASAFYLNTSYDSVNAWF